MRITKVTTKIGDKGTTSLGDGSNISKSDLRINCIGEVDELNSFIGFAKIAISEAVIVSKLIDIQNDLLNLGGELSIPSKELNLLKEISLSDLENKIDEMNAILPPLKEFILPGEDDFSARIHIARSVCRRTERNIVELIEREGGNSLWKKYINRLSDYLFVLARYYAKVNNIQENQWRK